jgi:hypothetical protein
MPWVISALAPTILIVPLLFQLRLFEFRWEIITDILVVYLSFFLLILVNTYRLSPRTTANQASRNEQILSPVTYEVDDQQLIIRNQFSETKNDWGTYRKTIETEEHFLLIYAVNPRCFQIIPKRAFASIEDQQTFRKMLNVKAPITPENISGLLKNRIVHKLPMVWFDLILFTITVGGLIYLALQS